MLSVQPYSISSVNTHKVSFKANNEKPVSSGDKTYPEPFKTHAGLKTGAAFGVLEAVCGAMTGGGIIYAPLALLVSLGCGALIDSQINEKHSALAADIDKYGKKEALKINDRAELTRNENVYHSSNTGLKIGAVLGALVQPLLGVIRTRSMPSIASLAFSIVSGIAGGAALGLITDYFSNNAAKEHADIDAARQKVMNK